MSNHERLFPHHMICRRYRAGRRSFGDRKRQPGVPAGRPVGGIWPVLNWWSEP